MMYQEFQLNKFMSLMAFTLLVSLSLVIFACCPGKAYSDDYQLRISSLEDMADLHKLDGELALDPRLLVHLVTVRNAEVFYSLLQMDVSREMARSETGIYDPVFFTSFRYDDIDQPRREDWQSQMFGLDITSAVEKSYNVESGVKKLLSTGAEITLSNRFTERESNLIPEDHEYTGLLSLELRQPLLRGRGRNITEADLQVAVLEHDISRQQYRQQVLMACGEALRAFWQLYRAQENLSISSLALDNARQVQQDVAVRVERGRAPGTDLLEAEIAVASREADLIRYEGLLEESMSRILTMLHVSSSSDYDLRLRAEPPEPHRDIPGDPPEIRLRSALKNWPGLIISETRLKQEDIRFDYARNQRLPRLDLLGGYHQHSLNEDGHKAMRESISNRYSSWNVGVNFELPLGNNRAGAQYKSQEVRLRQAELEIKHIRNSLVNELNMRWKQLLSAIQEKHKMAHDVQLRQNLLEIEQVQYERGRATISRVLEKEDELNESRRRLVESSVRLELAKVSMMMADVSLFEEYGIVLLEN
jgi:outer membrane protein TolC